jgi:hypothetical protein
LSYAHSLPFNQSNRPGFLFGAMIVLINKQESQSHAMKKQSGAGRKRCHRRFDQEKERMEARKHCAYNQTRECFLGLEIKVTDLLPSVFNDQSAKHDFQQGAGLWIAPFRGIPATGIPFPLDLIYLDEDCRVVHAVEHFPFFPPLTTNPQVKSLLALPTHSIYTSQTQPGDQMLICAAEEMEKNLEQILSLNENAAPKPDDFPAKQTPLAVTSDSAQESAECPAQETGVLAQRVRTFKPPKNWLDRLLSPDPRRSPRELVSNLAAYYWSNEEPQAHRVRDISSTGLYLLTEERWQVGTLVLMTLQESRGELQGTPHLFSVCSQVVRWGEDGVGLQFVLHDEKKSQQTEETAIAGTDKKELELFLQQLRRQNG